ncbi:hypothetical protein BD324DRAFT_582093 [Kockovaella imperatae]|uniref:Adenosine deaminase domain-containing protein n=1 Tax=Kockovaella imperatae TaxID=4999 RepID=A0A1Y1UBD8_9TREE|nr:hypothetical protein BD324DRAFT_582093 [Kockovaella imperatae]ORX35368.1 hypothetical protein BD324DRAFT_582093 [Kockovaella imperatae]
MPDVQFCRRLPKVELHAHLTGSITRPILQQIWEQRVAESPDFASVVAEPRLALADAKTGQSIGSFFAHFNLYIYHLVSTIPSLQFATRAVLEQFQTDGVAYLELRTTPRAMGSNTSEDYVRSILSVIKDWNTTQAMTTRLILSIDQAKHDAEKAMSIVEMALGLRADGEPVVGVDLCGDPHKPVDRSIFRNAFNKAAAHDLGITVHFAEVPESSTREILEEQLSWRPQRLGHVIHVPEALRRDIQRHGIGVELCLTCNVVAGMLPSDGSFSDHHFRQWWGGSSPVSLGTDDVGVFGSLHSEEHLLASQYFQLDRKDLIELSRQAIRMAFCEPEIKASIEEKLQSFAIIN